MSRLNLTFRSAIMIASLAVFSGQIAGAQGKGKGREKQEKREDKREDKRDDQKVKRVVVTSPGEVTTTRLTFWSSRLSSRLSSRFSCFSLPLPFPCAPAICPEQTAREAIMIADRKVRLSLLIGSAPAENGRLSQSTRC